MALEVVTRQYEGLPSIPTESRERYDPMIECMLLSELESLASPFGEDALREMQRPSITDRRVLNAPVMQYAFLYNVLSKALGTFEGKRILEIGCETGDFLFALLNKGAEVVGITPRIGSVIVGNALFIRHAGITDPVILAGLAEDRLKDIDGELDAIVSHNVMLSDTLAYGSFRQIIDECLGMTKYQAHASSITRDVPYPATAFCREEIVVRDIDFPGPRRVIEVIN
ncbi:MAG: hypothetical protein ABIE94_02800 [archaeon]